MPVPAHKTHQWLDEQEAALLHTLLSVQNDRRIYETVRRTISDQFVRIDKWRMELLEKKGVP